MMGTLKFYEKVNLLFLSLLKYLKLVDAGLQELIIICDMLVSNDFFWLL